MKIVDITCICVVVSMMYQAVIGRTRESTTWRAGGKVIISESNYDQICQYMTIFRDSNSIDKSCH